MHVFDRFHDKIAQALLALDGADAASDAIAASAFTVETPRDAGHGDLSSNAALVLSRAFGMKPRDLATRLAMKLQRDPDVSAVEVAGPGFVNIHVADRVWAAETVAALRAGDAFGRSAIGRGLRANVEYVSANPTGPLHVGHCRGAVVGDAIAGLLAATGHDVTREYYINDMGGQIEVLARSAELRTREALGETIGEIPAGLYPGDYLKAVGKALAAEHGRALLDRPEAERLARIADRTVAMMVERIRADLAALSIRHDVFFSERSLVADGNDAIGGFIRRLEGEGTVYSGRLPPPKGVAEGEEPWEDREQLLFRSTAFGDDVDRALLKADGRPTYFASDIAYHADKLARGFDILIDVWGADHAGYVKRMAAAVAAVSGGTRTLEVQLVQLVRLLRDGQPLKMSKRSGDLVTLGDIVGEVGADAVRFMMLFRRADAPLDFDFAAVTAKSRDNPVFYVQYAHARTASVRRQAAEAGIAAVDPSALEGDDLIILADEDERALLKRIAAWPKTVETAARAREPHRIAYALHDLAGAFHALWNKGKERPQLRFIKPDDLQATRARLALVDAVGLVIRNGLGLLGVTAPTEMT